MKQPKVSICIVNYNAREYLKKCLQSIDDYPLKVDFEIILVDNNSSDGSQEWVEKYFPQIRLIKNKENIGFPKANNQALKISRGEYLLSLNNDTVVQKDAIDILVEFMDSYPQASACGPFIFNKDGTMQRQCKRGWPTLWNSLTYSLGLWKLFPKNKWWKKTFGGYFLLEKPDDQTSEVDAVSGAVMLARRTVVEQVGVMREDYIMYWDDLDWCFRIKKAGGKIYYVPSAKVLHYGGAGGSQVHALKNLWYFHRGAYLFYHRYLASQSFFLNNLLYYIGIWFLFSYKFLTNIFRKEKIIGSKKPS